MMLLILILSTLIRLISLNQSFWLDEAAQATLSTHRLSEINWSADFQPPFFYTITHFWQGIGITSEWFLRLPSVIFAVLTVYVLFKLINDLNMGKPSRGGRPHFYPAILASILLATAPFHLYFSQEYRMYAFFTFLTTLSWYFLYNKKLAKYGLTILLAIFTHYFALLVIASQTLWILFYRPKSVQKYFKVLVLSIAPFILWLPVLAKQIQTANALISAWPKWETVAGITFWKFPFLLLAKFTVGMTSPEPRVLYALVVLTVGTIFVIAALPVMLNLIQHLKKIPKLVRDDKEGTPYSLFLFWFFIPTGLAWISSLWLSANSPHRLLFVLPAFYALIAIGLNKPQGLKALSLILFVILLSSNIYFSSLYLFNNKYHREDWRSAIAYTDQKVGAKGIVLTEQASPWAPMDWYSQKPKQYMGASTSMSITEKSVSDRLSPILIDKKPRGFGHLTPGVKSNSRIILYTYLYELSDPNRLVEQYLTQKGYVLTEEKDFHGVGIVKVFQQ